MPPVFRFYFRHVAIGFGLAAIFVAALLWLNIANLNHLIFSSDVAFLALFLLWFFNGLVFAGVQSSVAVMLMADRDDKGPGGGMPVPVHVENAKDEVAGTAATVGGLFPRTCIYRWAPDN